MRRHHHFVEAVIIAWIGARSARTFGLLPTAIFGFGIAAACAHPFLGAAYAIACRVLWLLWRVARMATGPVCPSGVAPDEHGGIRGRGNF
jgi:hypothetical protein